MAEAMQFAFLLRSRTPIVRSAIAPPTPRSTELYDLLAPKRAWPALSPFQERRAGAAWFRLGPPVTPIGYGAALVSWSARCSNTDALAGHARRRQPAEQTNRLIAAADRTARNSVCLGIRIAL